MSQTKTTAGFLAGAVGSVLLALVTWWGTQPAPVEGFGLVGEEFFADLKPAETTALRVVVYDPKQGDVQEPFVVENSDGIWRLPYYYDYPADGEDRLAETTTSLIGIKRGALRSRLASDHARFGVVDPLEEDPEILEGHGSRITLYKNGNVEKGIAVADLIIGKKATDFEAEEDEDEDSDEPVQVADINGDYYVRHPDEDETYVATLNIKLSTKFSDWVEDDLLKTQQDNLVNLEMRTIKQNPDRSIEQVAEATLTRGTSTDPWALSGLNEETEETNEDNIRDIVSTLDNLKLSAVRPRPRRRDGEPLLLGDLTLNIPKGVELNPQMEMELQRDIQGNLGQSGFGIYMDSKAGKVQLYARGGELSAGEKSGVRYHLSFGESFMGTQDEILVGGAPEETKKSEEKSEGKEGEEGEDEDDGKIASRFLIVRATYDESLLGPPLVEPVKPEVPEGVKVDEEGNVIEPEKPAAPETPEKPESSDTPSPAPEKKPEENDASDENACQEEEEKPTSETEKPVSQDTEKPGANAPQQPDAAKPGEEKPPEGKPETGDSASEETELPKPDPVAEYKARLSAWRIATIKYEQDVEDRKEKAKEGQKRVDELNHRFADWYYVITEEDYEKLRRTREELAKAKEKPEETEDTEPGASGPPKIGTPETGTENKPADTDEKPAGADEKPAETNEKPESTEKPAEETEKPESDSDPEKPADNN